MSETNKILVIGCGGIGSYFISELAECFEQMLISPNISITIADNDTAEIRQMKYQNFTKKDLGKNKAKALSIRFKEFGFKVIQSRIEKESHLHGFDVFVICADNNIVRKLVFEYCHKNKKEFIDLRAEGRLVFAMPKSDLQRDIGTLDLKDNASGSCQTREDLERGFVQKGNKIASLIGIQMILNLLRGHMSQKIVFRI